MEFLLIASAHFLALLSPGPDFFLILQASLRLPIRYAVGVCAGITVANALYLLVAVFSLEAIRQMAWLATTFKYLGAIYLVFLGIMLLRSPRRSFDPQETGTFLQAHHFGRQFLLGFMSAILNPKNMIFYLALFTVMVAQSTGLLLRCFYALWMTAVVLLWDCGVVLIFGRERVRFRLGRSVFFIEKIAGLMLTFFGLLFALS